MTWVVLDAGALTAFLVGGGPAAQDARAMVTTHRAAAPTSIDLHCLHLLDRLERDELLPAGEAQRAVTLLQDLPVRRYDTLALLPRMWQLRADLPPADAAVAALAETLDAELLTTGDTFDAAPLRCTVTRLPRRSPVSGGASPKGRAR